MNKKAAPEVKIAAAINSDDMNEVDRLFEVHPDKVHANSVFGPWLAYATHRASVGMVSHLINHSLDPNAPKKHSLANSLAEAARHGRLDVVKFLWAHGAKMDVHEPTANPLVSTISSNATDVAQYLLDEGIDATITYSGQNYQGMTAASLALEGGAIDVCHTIVLHIAGGDRDKAQALLLEAYETVKRNNPNAGSYPPPPAL